MEQLSTLPVQNNVSQYISNTVTLFRDTTQDLATGFYSNPDQLYGLIKNGQIFGAGLSETTNTVSEAVQKVLFANALPLTWTLGYKEAQPFIVTGDGVNVENPSGCDGYDPLGTDLHGLHVYAESDGTEEFFRSTFFCVDNAPYWLFSGKEMGLAALTGAQYAGLTANDVVANAVNNWIAAGKINTPALFNIEDQETIKALSDGDFTKAPGVVNIPVCTFEQAGSVVLVAVDTSNPYWPCPSG
ncbi:hypothetical protein LTR37_001177 [Vermiconidia calcicola]|uniref:Uncharacterized protein n=1 Tax=Vermiconidia calcicola TaxID=1690605 RepID=A0ACC3NVW9_9PEZI|nr:hypothetical protein LTR37_001177 [Vermiconidia calcicola]